jgi:DNA-binding MarR family transcriptional regulator
VDKANVARAVKGLLSLGYMERIRDEYDRRIWRVSLTEKGAGVRREVEDVSARWLEHLSSGISEKDWNRTEEILGRIAASAVFTSTK